MVVGRNIIVIIITCSQLHSFTSGKLLTPPDAHSEPTGTCDDEMDQPAAKKPKLPGPVWPSLVLTGPGTHTDELHPGTKVLNSLVGDVATLEAVFCASMGLNGKWLLEEGLGLGETSTTQVLIVCHHPIRCWSGNKQDRRVGGTAVPGHTGAVLMVLRTRSESVNSCSR